MSRPSSRPLHRYGGIAVLAAAIVSLGACASTPPPPLQSMTAAREAIARAEQADARQYAGAELDEARQQLVQAEREVTSENMVLADRLARQSRVAAELSEARAETAKAMEINREISRGATALQEELNRTGDPR